MNTYEFTVIVPDMDKETAEAIYARCADSSLGKSNGTTYVAFDREAESLESAIASAVADLTGIGVRPIRVEMEVPVTAG